MDFEIIGTISSIESVAIGTGIRDLPRLRKQYGTGNWKKLKGFAQIRLIDGTIHTAELHWYESHGIGKREFKIKFPLLDSRTTNMTTQHNPSFAVCVNNDGYTASLEIGKLYQVLPDSAAEAHGYIRVIDESGEDYGYSKNRFYPLDIPTALQDVLMKVA